METAIVSFIAIVTDWVLKIMHAEVTNRAMTGFTLLKEEV